RECPRHDREQLDVSEPSLRAERRRAEQRHDEVAERHRRKHGRMLRRCPDQLGPTPPEQQADRGPPAEPCWIVERRELEARETSVYPACSRIQRADEIPDVA